MTIRMVDLCCKAGGCSVGYMQAAQELGITLEIVGVDIQHQPNYPFPFIKADAVRFIKACRNSFDFIHASPPCQAYSIQTISLRKKGQEYIDILKKLRTEMQRTKKPYVIENVPGAPMRADLVFRGDMFGLKVLRKRLFEIEDLFVLQPGLPTKKGSERKGDFVTVTGNGHLKTRAKNISKVEGNTIIELWSNAMGIDWMTKKELSQAIPPAYTKYIGLHIFPNIKPSLK